jgi:hypothetical protein
MQRPAWSPAYRSEIQPTLGLDAKQASFALQYTFELQGTEPLSLD